MNRFTTYRKTFEDPGKGIAGRLLILFALLLCMASLSACGGKEEAGGSRGEDDPVTDTSWKNLQQTGSMELSYAECFSVDYYGSDYSLIRIENSGTYLLAEEGAPLPEDLPEDYVILRKPLVRIYAASSSTLDFFRQLDTLDQVTMTSTKASDWTIPEIRSLVESDDITYVGKYSAPDYEYILDETCSLAIENTMVYHNPEVKENLESLGIPVLVEMSSYEPHPLGRLEWVRLYGLLTDKEDEADLFYREQLQGISDILDRKESGQKEISTGIFCLNANGGVLIRRPGDYLSRMVELAGGSYLFSGMAQDEGNASASMTLQMESFYRAAVDADLLIYNTTVYGGPESLEALLERSPLFADLKSIQTGQIYCTGRNMYQQATGTCGMIRDFNTILQNGDTDDAELTYLYRLE